LLRFSVFLALVSCCLILSTACVSVATTKSAESSKKDEINVGINFSTKQYLKKGVYPVLSMLEPYVIYGVSDKLDVEARYHWGPMLGAKYTTFQDTKYSAAAETSIGIIGLNGITDRPNIVDLYGTLLFSSRFRLVHTVTVGPKIIMRSLLGGENQYFFGAFINTRLKINPTVHVTPELSYLNRDSLARLFSIYDQRGNISFSVGLNHQF